MSRLRSIVRSSAIQCLLSAPRLFSAFWARSVSVTKWSRIHTRLIIQCTITWIRIERRIAACMLLSRRAEPYEITTTGTRAARSAWSDHGHLRPGRSRTCWNSGTWNRCFHIYWNKNQLQGGTDAAALAGATYFNNVTFTGKNGACLYATDAQNAACTYALNDGVLASELTSVVANSSNQSMTVSASRRVPRS
jgi:hypothetical protein